MRTNDQKQPSVQLQPVDGTFNSKFEVLVDGVGVGTLGWVELKELVAHQFAQGAPTSIRLKGAEALVVYERRTSPGTACSDDAIRLEIDQEKIDLSADAALDLAKVLLAYSVSTNLRGQWLVRKELS